MIAEHEHVSGRLLDWKSFSSTSRPWHDPASLRPEILLTANPRRHTQVREVIADTLSSRVLARIEALLSRSLLAPF